MAEVESAEEFARSYFRFIDNPTAPGDPLCARIRARDTAIRGAAKLELLAELRAMASEERFDIIQSNTICYVASELRAKYQSADSQPAQDGERR